MMADTDKEEFTSVYVETWVQKLYHFISSLHAHMQ
jgi:hypothetical protein